MHRKCSNQHQNHVPVSYTHLDVYKRQILYRFGDALKDLEGIEGVQTHRSWWVAIGAIEENQKDYGKNFYLLKNQIKAPISRSFMKGLKALNLL